MRLLTIFILATLTLAASPEAYASRALPPGLGTQLVLDRWHRALARIRADCGRFPTTEEGLDALVEQPKSLPCPDKRDRYWDYWYERGHDKDAWKEKLRYASDGNSYRIDASHGYYVTDKSTKKWKDNRVWENDSGGESGWILAPEIQPAAMLLLVGVFLLMASFSIRFFTRGRKRTLASTSALILGILLLLAAIFSFVTAPNV